jgi:hypothetical protein
MVRYLKELIQHSRTLITASWSAALAAEIEEYRDIFDRQLSNLKPSNLTFFTFHVNLPRELTTIHYVDVEHDHSLFDYDALLAHLFWAVDTLHPAARIVYVTDELSTVPPCKGNVDVVRLPLRPACLMFERVKAMAAFVESTAFCNNVVFLDSDAFPNRDLSPAFEKGFDIGLTYRTRPGFMPINEGVLFCTAHNKSDTRNFFRTYMGTYERLLHDEVITRYYGDIKRWRGGQLSLSCVSPPLHAKDDNRVDAPIGVKIDLLPCETHNFTLRRDAAMRGRVLNEKYILHLKGDTKKHLPSVAAYQRYRFAQLKCQATS